MITTVVGNYPKIGGAKAPNLRSAITQLDRGHITLEELHQIEDQVTTEVIQEQVDAGIDLITDGQVRWDDGLTYFAGKITGFTLSGLLRYFDTNTYYRQPVAQGPLTWQGPITAGDFQFAVAHSSRPVKQVITGPYPLARLCRTEHHPSLTHMVMELAEVLNREAQELEDNPAEELAELTVLFQREGKSYEEARHLADEIAEDKDLWLRTLVEKELGITYDATTSPMRDALAMGSSFILAAMVPIIPHMFLDGDLAIAVSIAAALAGLFVLGVGKGRLVQKSPLLQGLEILGIGVVSAGIGFALGDVIPRLVT